MTQDEIIAETIKAHDQMLKRLWCIAYEEGQKAEREACAKVCEEVEMRFGRDGDDLEQYGANQCATAIRARGEK